MKTFCVMFLLLTPGVCEDDDDDVKYISKRNSGRMTAFDISYYIFNFALKAFIFLSFLLCPPLFYSALLYLFCCYHSLLKCLFYPWGCHDELLMLNLKYMLKLAAGKIMVFFLDAALLFSALVVLCTMVSAYFLLEFSQN